MNARIKQLCQQIFYSSTIFKKLVIFITVISIVPIVFVSMLLFDKISAVITDELLDSHEQLTAQYISNLSNKLHQYRYSLKMIANNTVIIHTLMDKMGENNAYINGKSISIEVDKSLQGDNIVLHNCMIYSNVESNKVYGRYVSMISEIEREIWYKNETVIHQDHFIYSNLNKEKILSIIQKIVYMDIQKYENEDIGFIKLDINMNRLLEPEVHSFQQGYYYDVIALDKRNNIIYSSNKKYNDIVIHMPYETLKEKRVNYFKDTIVCTGSENEYGFKFIFLFNGKQLSIKKNDIIKTVFPIIIIVIGIIIVTTFIFTQRFTKKVEKLIQKIKGAEIGDFTINEEIEGNDEIAILDKQFNRMLLKLDQLIKKNYIQQLEKKEGEYRNLQLQINPHFLYNTLETISSIAAIHQLFIICDLCEKLGENFRYSLGKNYKEFVTVKEELLHTQNYVYIQQTRFRNKFDVLYNIDQETENKLMLRFILQPIVENAIVHGLSQLSEKGTLEIFIKTTEKLLIIKIIDSGIGMSLEKVKKINEYINDNHSNDPKQKTQGIGIRNVNRRIKLACGDEYGISLESTLDAGSCFTMILPLME